jgi:hypothetical protein
MGDILYPLLIRVKWGNNKYIRCRMFKKLTFYIRLPHTNISTGIFQLISFVIRPVLCIGEAHSCSVGPLHKENGREVHSMSYLLFPFQGWLVM